MNQNQVRELNAAIEAAVLADEWRMDDAMLHEGDDKNGI